MADLNSILTKLEQCKPLDNNDIRFFSEKASIRNIDKTIKAINEKKPENSTVRLMILNYLKFYAQIQLDSSILAKPDFLTALTESESFRLRVESSLQPDNVNAIVYVTKLIANLWSVLPMLSANIKCPELPKKQNREEWNRQFEFNMTTLTRLKLSAFTFLASNYQSLPLEYRQGIDSEVWSRFDEPSVDEDTHGESRKFRALSNYNFAVKTVGSETILQDEMGLGIYIPQEFESIKRFSLVDYDAIDFSLINARLTVAQLQYIWANRKYVLNKQGQLNLVKEISSCLHDNPNDKKLSKLIKQMIADGCVYREDLNYLLIPLLAKRLESTETWLNGFEKRNLQISDMLWEHTDAWVRNAKTNSTGDMLLRYDEQNKTCLLYGKNGEGEFVEEEAIKDTKFFELLKKHQFRNDPEVIKWLEDHLGRTRVINRQYNYLIRLRKVPELMVKEKLLQQFITNCSIMASNSLNTLDTSVLLRNMGARIASEELLKCCQDFIRQANEGQGGLLNYSNIVNTFFMLLCTNDAQTQTQIEILFDNYKDKMSGWIASFTEQQAEKIIPSNMEYLYKLLQGKNDNIYKSILRSHLLRTIVFREFDKTELLEVLTANKEKLYESGISNEGEEADNAVLAIRETAVRCLLLSNFEDIDNQDIQKITAYGSVIFAVIAEGKLSLQQLSDPKLGYAGMSTREILRHSVWQSTTQTNEQKNIVKYLLVNRDRLSDLSLEDMQKLVCFLDKEDAQAIVNEIFKDDEFDYGLIQLANLLAVKFKRVDIGLSIVNKSGKLLVGITYKLISGQTLDENGSELKFIQQDKKSIFSFYSAYGVQKFYEEGALNEEFIRLLPGDSHLWHVAIVSHYLLYINLLSHGEAVEANKIFTNMMKILEEGSKKNSKLHSIFINTFIAMPVPIGKGLKQRLEVLRIINAVSTTENLPSALAGWQKLAFNSLNDKPTNTARYNYLANIELTEVQENIRLMELSELVYNTDSSTFINNLCTIFYSLQNSRIKFEYTAKSILPEMLEQLWLLEVAGDWRKNLDPKSKEIQLHDKFIFEELLRNFTRGKNVASCILSILDTYYDPEKKTKPVYTNSEDLNCLLMLQYAHANANAKVVDVFFEISDFQRLFKIHGDRNLAPMSEILQSAFASLTEKFGKISQSAFLTHLVSSGNIVLAGLQTFEDMEWFVNSAIGCLGENTRSKEVCSLANQLAAIIAKSGDQAAIDRLFKLYKKFAANENKAQALFVLQTILYLPDSVPLAGNEKPQKVEFNKHDLKILIDYPEYVVEFLSNPNFVSGMLDFRRGAPAQLNAEILHSLLERPQLKEVILANERLFKFVLPFLLDKTGSLNIHDIMELLNDKEMSTDNRRVTAAYCTLVLLIQVIDAGQTIDSKVIEEFKTIFENSVTRRSSRAILDYLRDNAKKFKVDAEALNANSNNYDPNVAKKVLDKYMQEEMQLKISKLNPNTETYAQAVLKIKDEYKLLEIGDDQFSTTVSFYFEKLAKIHDGITKVYDALLQNILISKHTDPCADDVINSQIIAHLEDRKYEGLESCLIRVTDNAPNNSENFLDENRRAFGSAWIRYSTTPVQGQLVLTAILDKVPTLELAIKTVNAVSISKTIEKLDNDEAKLGSSINPLVQQLAEVREKLTRAKNEGAKKKIYLEIEQIEKILNPFIEKKNEIIEERKNVLKVNGFDPLSSKKSPEYIEQLASYLLYRTERVKQLSPEQIKSLVVKELSSTLLLELAAEVVTWDPNNYRFYELANNILPLIEEDQELHEKLKQKYFQDKTLRRIRGIVDKLLTNRSLGSIFKDDLGFLIEHKEAVLKFRQGNDLDKTDGIIKDAETCPFTSRLAICMEYAVFITTDDVVHLDKFARLAARLMINVGVRICEIDKAIYKLDWDIKQDNKLLTEIDSQKPEAKAAQYRIRVAEQKIADLTLQKTNIQIEQNHTQQLCRQISKRRSEESQIVQLTRFFSFAFDSRGGSFDKQNEEFNKINSEKISEKNIKLLAKNFGLLGIARLWSYREGQGTKPLNNFTLLTKLLLANYRLDPEEAFTLAQAMLEEIKDLNCKAALLHLIATYHCSQNDYEKFAKVYAQFKGMKLDNQQFGGKLAQEFIMPESYFGYSHANAWQAYQAALKNKDQNAVNYALLSLLIMPDIDQETLALVLKQKTRIFVLLGQKEFSAYIPLLSDATLYQACKSGWKTNSEKIINNPALLSRMLSVVNVEYLSTAMVEDITVKFGNRDFVSKIQQELTPQLAAQLFNANHAPLQKIILKDEHLRQNLMHIISGKGILSLNEMKVFENEQQRREIIEEFIVYFMLNISKPQKANLEEDTKLIALIHSSICKHPMWESKENQFKPLKIMIMKTLMASAKIRELSLADMAVLTADSNLTLLSEDDLHEIVIAICNKENILNKQCVQIASLLLEKKGGFWNKKLSNVDVKMLEAFKQKALVHNPELLLGLKLTLQDVLKDALDNDIYTPVELYEIYKEEYRDHYSRLNKHGFQMAQHFCQFLLTEERCVEVLSQHADRRIVRYAFENKERNVPVMATAIPLQDLSEKNQILLRSPEKLQLLDMKEELNSGHVKLIVEFDRCIKVFSQCVYNMLQDPYNLKTVGFIQQVFNNALDDLGYGSIGSLAYTDNEMRGFFKAYAWNIDNFDLNVLLKDLRVTKEMIIGKIVKPELMKQVSAKIIDKLGPKFFRYLLVYKEKEVRKQARANPSSILDVMDIKELFKVCETRESVEQFSMRILAEQKSKKGRRQISLSILSDHDFLGTLDKGFVETLLETAGEKVCGNLTDDELLGLCTVENIRTFPERCLAVLVDAMLKRCAENKYNPVAVSKKIQELFLDSECAKKLKKLTYVPKILLQSKESDHVTLLSMLTAEHLVEVMLNTPLNLQQDDKADIVMFGHLANELKRRSANVKAYCTGECKNNVYQRFLESIQNDKTFGRGWLFILRRPDMLILEDRETQVYHAMQHCVNEDSEFAEKEFSAFGKEVALDQINGQAEEWKKNGVVAMGRALLDSNDLSLFTDKEVLQTFLGNDELVNELMTRKLLKEALISARDFGLGYGSFVNIVVGRLKNDDKAKLEIIEFLLINKEFTEASSKGSNIDDQLQNRKALVMNRRSLLTQAIRIRRTLQVPGSTWNFVHDAIVYNKGSFDGVSVYEDAGYILRDKATILAVAKDTNNGKNADAQKFFFELITKNWEDFKEIVDYTNKGVRFSPKDQELLLKTCMQSNIWLALGKEDADRRTNMRGWLKEQRKNHSKLGLWKVGLFFRTGLTKNKKLGDMSENPSPDFRDIHREEVEKNRSEPKLKPMPKPIPKPHTGFGGEGSMFPIPKQREDGEPPVKKLGDLLGYVEPIVVNN